MVLSPACAASPGHARFLDNRRIFPVVVSAPRYEAIIGRSRMHKKHAALAAKREEEKYLKFLKEGSNWLCKHFTNVGATTLDEEKQAKLDQELREAEIREKQVKLEDDMIRKKRVLRAHEILENMKAGQRALRTAVIVSEVHRQRKYNEALNREIAEDGRRQRRLEDEICPEQMVIPRTETDEELKAQEQAKAAIVRAEILKDLEERRERKEALKEQENFDVIVERAQYQCLYEKEKKEAKERADRKREFCRRAYREAIEEKAEVKKFENMCDRIDDRVICVDVTRRRNNEMRNKKIFNAKLAKKIEDREQRAIQVYRMRQENERKDDENRIEVEDNYQAEVAMDEGRRQCQKQDLARLRRAYELEQRKQCEKKAQQKAQIRTFEIAERFKNMETNKRFSATQQRHKDKETKNIRDILFNQRDEFLERRQAEQMRMSACQEDPYLQNDIAFFQQAYKEMKDGRKAGRPLFPIAKAVEVYRRKNQIDVVPEGRMVGRRKLRDYCWPGYFSKADLAYRNYAHREKCREEQERDRQDIFNNCIKITTMAAEEQPYKKCTKAGLVKCCQHRGLPAVDSVDSFDCGSNAYYNVDNLAGDCPLQGCPSNAALNNSLCLSQTALKSQQSNSLKLGGRKGSDNLSQRSSCIWRYGPR